MKIYLLGINFFPELTGIAVYNTELCEYLSEKGNDVVVITGFPYYPRWKKEIKYRKKLFADEKYHNISVRRCYLYVPEKVTTAKRILHEISFVISSFFRLFSLEKPDLLFTVSPPLLLGLTSVLYKKIKKVPYVFHVQDLQPDAAKSLEMIKDGLLMKLLYKVEKCSYQGAVQVSCVSEGMKEKIVTKGVPEEKIYLLRNWVETDLFKPYFRPNEFREEQNLKDKTVILHYGNMGVKQGLEVIIKTAELLKGNQDLVFILSGDGVRRDYLVDLAKKKNSRNVLFLPVQPKDKLPLLLASADICVLTQKKSVRDILLPSKLLGIMASEKPLIISANEESEVVKLAKRIDCAVVIEPENPTQLKEAILDLLASEELRVDLARKGRDYASENLDKDKTLLNYFSFLENLVKK